MKTPETQKAAVIEQGPNPNFAVTTLPVPELGPNDLLVKLSVTGICGTDLALATGKLGPCCRVLGHEGVGRVVKIGVGIGGSSVKIGDRVGVSWVRDSCGECTPCIRGDETRCEKQIHSGRVVDGTLAQYTVVPFRHLICLPEGLPDEQIAPIMCAGVTAYKALKICGAIPGQWVVISGAGGGVGAMAIQYAHAMGYRVLAIDAGEQKSEYCLRLQAEAYLNILEHQNLASVVNQITGSQGAAAVLVAAGSAQAYQDAFDMLAAFGTLVCVGIPAPDQRVGFHPLKFIDKGIRVIGSMVGSKGDIQEALQFVERHVVVPEVQTIRMDDISSLMPLFTSDQATTKYVVKLD